MIRAFLSMALVAAMLGAQSPEAAIADHVRRGVAAREAGRLEEAQRELEAAVRKAPDLAEAHLFLGLVLHERKDFEGAQQSLSRALALKPDLPGARELLGYELLRLGQFGEAIPQLEKALRENPDRARVSAWLGQAYLRAGRPDEAAAHLEAARSVSDTDPELLYLLGKAYSQLSLSWQAELMASAPDSAYARLAAAEDHDVNGRPEEALADYRRALEKKPDLQGVWLAIGDIERDRGDRMSPVEAYRQGLEIEPEEPTLHLRYGQGLVQLGRSNEALPHLERAARSDPTPPGALAALGKAQMDLNRLTDAETTLKKALAAAVDEQERMQAHYHLARIYQKQGLDDAAQAHLREFGALRAKLTSDER